MAEEIEPAVKITLKDVWAAQVETSKQVARLVDQLPDHVKQTQDDLAEVRAVAADHEARLRKLEQRIWMAIGGLSLLITGATIAVAFITK